MRAQIVHMNCRYQMRPHCTIIIVVLLLSPFLLSQEQGMGSLRALVVDLNGKPLPNATAELLETNEVQATYRGQSKSDGMIRMGGIVAGDYTLVISIPDLPRRAVRVQIKAGRETDAGRIIVGAIDCYVPGVNCEDWGSLKGTYSLPCMKGLSLLRNSSGALVVVESDELERRAIRRQIPEWPRNIISGLSIHVAVIIGVKGDVLCAAVIKEFGDPEGVPSKVAIVAAQKWKFQPILSNGIPKPAFGIIIFEISGLQ